MDDGDGVYYSGVSHRSSAGRWPQRLKKAAVGLVGLAALFGGGTFLVTSVLAARTGTDGPGALAPASPPGSSPAEVRLAPAHRSPAPGPIPGTLGAARQSSRPSPTPSPPPSLAPAPLTDDEVAASQVSRLLQAPAPAPTASGLTATSSPVTVTRETAADGSAIRVVAARYDLTGRGELLAAADRGHQTGKARCTDNFRVPGSEAAQSRPGLLLCWRTSAARSVVTVAVRRTGAPGTTASVAAINRAWTALD
jgi:hypothetical protein